MINVMLKYLNSTMKYYQKYSHGKIFIKILFVIYADAESLLEMHAYDNDSENHLQQK